MSNKTSPRLSKGDRKLLLAMERHLDACYGTGERQVFHEMVSPLIHVDIHVIAPTLEFPHYRLVTCGMAERPMTVPESFEWSPYAELTIALPLDWPITDRRKLRDPKVHWPLAMLRDFARMTHAHNTYLWEGHSATWGAPGRPFADDTDLSGVLFLAPASVPDGFEEFTCGKRTVSMLGLYPLHAAEMDRLQEDGLDALYDRLEAAGTTDVVDKRRASVA